MRHHVAHHCRCRCFVHVSRETPDVTPCHTSSPQGVQPVEPCRSDPISRFDSNTPAVPLQGSSPAVLHHDHTMCPRFMRYRHKLHAPAPRAKEQERISRSMSDHSDRRASATACLSGISRIRFIHYSNQILCSSNVFFVLCLVVQRFFESGGV